MLWSARFALLLAIIGGSAVVATAPAPAWAQGMQAMSADTLQRVLPAVVSITISKVRPAQRGADQNSVVHVQAFGSGFIVDPTGIIVTNRHVIEGAQSITIGLMDKSRLAARLIAAGRTIDVAVLKVDAGRPLPVLTFDDSDRLRIGDLVLAIGNPLGVGMSVSSGIVSALNRDIMDTPFDDYIQTDAAINHGNSGGPLIDAGGHVVGVDTAIYSSEGNTGSVGVGFAIPSNVVQAVVRHLLDPEHVRPGWLGVRAQEVTPDIADAVGLKRIAGALVAQVDSGSPAAQAGIHEGDVILEYQQKQIGDSRELLRLIASSPIGDTVPLVVWRDERELSLSAKVVLDPTDLSMPIRPPATTGGNNMMVNYGVHLSPITDAGRQKFGLPATRRGVLVSSVEANSIADESGARPGDVIVKVGDRPVASPAELRDDLALLKSRGHKSALVLTVGKGGAQRWMAVPLNASR